MAIVKLSKEIPTEGEIELKVDNGDLEAIKDIQEKWGFKDESSVLRFAVAVLVKATNNGSLKVYVDESGEKTSLVPGKSLLKEEEKPDATK